MEWFGLIWMWKICKGLDLNVIWRQMILPITGMNRIAQNCQTIVKMIFTLSSAGLNHKIGHGVKSPDGAFLFLEQNACIISYDNYSNSNRCKNTLWVCFTLKVLPGI